MSTAAKNLGVKQDAVLKLKAALDSAQAYVDRIGKPYSVGTKLGALEKVFIETAITHCDEPGAAMRHVNDHFDDALSDLIREKFPNFARVALARIRTRYEQALKDQHAELSAALAEIHALNAKEINSIPPEARPNWTKSQCVGRHGVEPLRIYKFDNCFFVEEFSDHAQAWERLAELNRETHTACKPPLYYIPLASTSKLEGDQS